MYFRKGGNYWLNSLQKSCLKMFDFLYKNPYQIQVLFAGSGLYSAIFWNTFLCVINPVFTYQSSKVFLFLERDKWEMGYLERFSRENLTQWVKTKFKQIEIHKIGQMCMFLSIHSLFYKHYWETFSYYSKITLC
jgi:hypothetical protein